MCIEDYDHHCVFFSKCIGGGNLPCFWGTLGGVLFNFLNIAIMLGCTQAFGKGLSDSKEVTKNLSNQLAGMAGIPSNS